MKRRILLPVVGLIAFLMTSSALLWAGSVQVEVQFKPDELSFTRSSGYDLVTLEDAVFTAEVGAPCLPLIQVNVAIPTDAVPVVVRVLGTETIELPGKYDILPNAEPLPLGAAPRGNPFFQDPAVYGKDALYPEFGMELLGSSMLAGQDLAILNAAPLQYNPVSRKLVFHETIRFEVVFQEAADPVRETFNFSEKTKRRLTRILKAMVVNPQEVAPIPDYLPPLASALVPGDYEYVIICPPDFSAGFQPLADWRTQMGMPAQIVETDWIYANYAGIEKREMIKEFVRDANATWGAMYFLLGGDTGYVPYQLKYIDGEYIPNDTYYARLNLETVSWMYNVYVGRACVNNAGQVADFVDKVLAYEKSPPDNFGNTVFFMGFDLDSSTHGEDAMEGIKNSYIPAYSHFEREYDSEAGGHEDDVKAYMSQGQNLVNHCDHCNTSYLGVGSVNHGTGLTNTEAQSFTNGDRLSNLYTIGCWAGNYPSTCWGEALTRDDQGGITFVGNSRYGWYSPGNPHGYSMSYCKKWWQALFDPALNAYRAGETLAVSCNLIFPGPTLFKYIFTELNLLGDPGLHLWTDNPAALQVSHATTINTGSQLFSVHVESGSAALEGALVCAMKGGEVYAYETTDAGGDVALSIDPATTGTLTVTVTAQNHKYHEGAVDVTLANDPPTIDSVAPCCGPEAGSTPVTITGSHFTMGPPVTASVGGNACTNLLVVDDQTLTCTVPAGTDGWHDVQVANSFGNDILVEGFRYFPVGSSPFNGTDVHTESLDAPAAVTLIASGLPATPIIFFFSYGGGPTTTPYGTMGLDLPINYAFSIVLATEGWFLFPLTLTPGYGPLDIYLHVLGLDGTANPVWAAGGNNPNGSGSIWIHLNN